MSPTTKILLFIGAVVGSLILGMAIAGVCNWLDVEDCGNLAVTWMILVVVIMPICVGLGCENADAGGFAFMIAFGCSIFVGIGGYMTRERWYWN